MESELSAIDVLLTVREVVCSSSWKTGHDLIDSIRTRRRQINKIDTTNSCIEVSDNVIRRILKIIRDESSSQVQVEQNEKCNVSLHRMVQDNNTDDVGDSIHTQDIEHVDGLKQKIIDAVDELHVELEASCDEIMIQSVEHIHANEIILTYGFCSTVEKFLKHVARDRKFQVIVVESHSPKSCHKLAENLSTSSNMTVTVIPNSAVFAIMSRVNKVIIESCAILADGGLKAVIGTHTIALSAKHHAVPVYVCASVIKLCPVFTSPGDGFQKQFNSFSSPFSEMDFDLVRRLPPKTRLVSPVFEYVDPSLVTLFITNMSGQAPSYIYRLLTELYHSDDYELDIHEQSSC